MPNLNQILLYAYRMSPDIVSFEIHRRLLDMFPGCHILVTDDYDFNLDTFAEDGRCVAWDLKELENLLLAEWRGRDKGGRLTPRHAFFEVLWNTHRLKCLRIELDCTSVYFLIAENEQIGMGFFEAVCRYVTEADGRVLVFDGGFRRDKNLERAVEQASWDTLVLPEAQKTALMENVVGFFSAKETYAKYGVAWKRGVMLHGPPGNGKTHALKALIKAARRPCVVVRSLRIYDQLEEKVISYVFSRARQMAPAILVFEDIDSLIQKSHLSALLNEMDGFAANDGLLSLATTNHLEKLDDAIAKRPSRFDRKFEFPNPKRRERQGFLTGRFAALEPQMRPSEEAIGEASLATKGFSGAMLQELVGSCTMAWMKREGKIPMDEVVREEVAGLRTVRADSPREGEEARKARKPRG